MIIELSGSRGLIRRRMVADAPWPPRRSWPRLRPDAHWPHPPGSADLL